MVYLPDIGVNRRDRLGGIPAYASAQSLDFHELGQKSSFLNWKGRQVSIFIKTINRRTLTNKIVDSYKNASCLYRQRDSP
jgi:hypothetical protein